MLKVHSSHFIDADIRTRRARACALLGLWDPKQGLASRPCWAAHPAEWWQVRGEGWAGMWVLMGGSTPACRRPRVVHPPARPGEPIDSRVHQVRGSGWWQWSGSLSPGQPGPAMPCGWSREGTSLPPAAQGPSPAQLLLMCGWVVSPLCAVVFCL